ncbi:hypothetical protein [Paraburkholderia sp. C35]|uniref:hypothetical protein n=1 Tax=Paraburkholderia sp. C35 TaxID=2126993 RepID=UPI000D68750A|nr:hypothetical protein [Paraburkholderia sp. C35]
MTGSIVDWITLLTRRKPLMWIAGAILLLASTASFANDHLHVTSEKNSPFILFYSYPIGTPSTYAPQRRVHRFVVKDPGAISNAAFNPSENENIAHGKRKFRVGNAPGNPYLAPLDGVQSSQSPTLPLYGFGLPSDPQGLPPTAASDDDWSFRANPLYNMNHAHERGATFSIRHDF